MASIIRPRSAQPTSARAPDFGFNERSNSSSSSYVAQQQQQHPQQPQHHQHHHHHHHHHLNGGGSFSEDVGAASAYAPYEGQDLFTLAEPGLDGGAPHTAFESEFGGTSYDEQLSHDANVAGSSSPFRFPELPSHLLDQAPEYEYSSHTRANVFDSGQEYPEEPILGLDEYGNLSYATPEEPVWRNMQDPASLTATPVATYADSPSLYEPEPRYLSDPRDATPYGAQPRVPLAPPPPSRDYYNVNVYSNAGAKRRRDSYDESFAAQEASTSANGGGGGLGNGAFWPAAATAPRGVNPFLPPAHAPVSYPSAQRGVPPQDYTARRQPQPQPPQQAPSRGRMQSWNEAPPLQHRGSAYSEDWQANYEASTSHNGAASSLGPPPRGGSGSSYVSSGTAMGPPGGPSSGAASGQEQVASSSSVNKSRVSVGSDGEGSSGSGGGTSIADVAATSASQNEMINKLNASMDAAMETDGVAKCPYPRCDKTFAKNRSYNLKAHLRSHSQLKPFACTHCPRAFSRKHDLERHARVHSGDKPYLCEACNKGFPRSDALRRHWRVEKECGERAAEMEASQTLPALPPGAAIVVGGGQRGEPMEVLNAGYGQPGWESNDAYSSYDENSRRSKRQREDY